MACAASAGLEDPTWFPGAVAALFGPRAVVKRREPIVFAGGPSRQDGSLFPYVTETMQGDTAARLDAAFRHAIKSAKPHDFDGISG